MKINKKKKIFYFFTQLHNHLKTINDHLKKTGKLCNIICIRFSRFYKHIALTHKLLTQFFSV